ncbi:MAG: hypothetical protein AAFW73_14740 [Bacteroidota bacterium]
MNRLIAFVLLLLAALPVAEAQKKDKDKIKLDLSGSWQGVVTQEEGYSTEYALELYLRQDGNKITGRSYVSVDSIYAEMEIEGVALADKILMIKDIRIIDDEIIEKLEWCIKSYQLMLRREQDVWHLEGRWQGKTSTNDCTPGQVYLRKSVPRA